MEPKPILFIDWNGTLNNEHFFRSLDAATYGRVQTFLFGASKEMVVAWMKGVYTSEQVVAQVAHHLGIPFEDLWDVFVDDCATMTLEPRVAGALKALRDRYTLILITGNMDCFTRFTVPALKLDELFDEISSSHEEGVLKEENGGVLFLQYVEKYKGVIGKAHLFDDSEMVCEVFQMLGGTAHRITKEKPLIEGLSGLV